jgi:ElaB/YqjD/DUF883 family membrane-anchored ribosome-binding protein
MSKRTSGAAAHTTNEPVTAQDLLENLKSVMRDGEALLRATEGQTGEKIAEARARAEESLGNARERVYEATANLQERARSAAHSADDYVKENPWTAIAVAAGIGFVIGSLNRRR